MRKTVVGYIKGIKCRSGKDIPDHLGWDLIMMIEKHYNTLNTFLRGKFCKKVLKVCIDGSFTCPNRDGKCGYEGCIFCGERGSGEHLLENKNMCGESNLKRKAETVRICKLLWLLHGVLCFEVMLNRRLSNGMCGDVRGMPRKGYVYSTVYSVQ